MYTKKLLALALPAFLFLTGCHERLDQITVTAPEVGTVLTLTNGSNITLRDVEIHIDVATVDEPWQSVPDVAKGATLPIDLTNALENLHRHKIPHGTTIIFVQLKRAQQSPQVMSWKFKEVANSGGSIRIVTADPQK